ncbi:MAG: hypothetical protein HOV81_19070 [Kofleriaceae bacterium]|nr:hypothetical protein [Kofleriaceae bacterium]
MRRFTQLALSLSILAACAHKPPRISVEGAVLGRVVIYRNGVAFYERTAKVVDGKVAVHVPRDRVDDFLKSLTVVDPVTRKPLAVSIPRQEADDGSYLTMTLETTDAAQNGDVLLTYVTESPAWKPSYRVVVGADDKVMLEGWAIVDNVSGEDWKNVLVGVGASSALSFRYDLWSVRRIDRDLLQGEERFAVAPPTGMSPYDANSAGEVEELASLGGDEVRATPGSQNDGAGVAFSGSSSLEDQYYVDGVNTAGYTGGVDTTGTNSPSSSPAPVQPKTGGIRGEVSDKKSGTKVAGVTVIATPTNNSKQTFTAITGSQGEYSIPDAPPGQYLITFYYGDQTIERNGITVGAGKTTPVYQKLDNSMGAGETIAVQDTAPMVDVASTSTGVTITRDYVRNIPVPGRTFESALGAAPGSSSDGGSRYIPPSPIKQGDAKLAGIVDKVLKSKKDVVVEAYGLNAAEVAKRAEAVKHKLIDDGVPATRIKVVHKTGSQEHRIRVYAIAPTKTDPTASAPPSATRGATSDTPVGESHFMADRPMNVRAGTSAMVAMLHGETTGGVVYLYDPISERGDDRFAFKAVRLDNPTDDTLEPGPVTVYGEGRFIGEGITEPVPPHASVVVPFASDRQIIVSKNATDSDRIAKLVTAQRGIITAEIQHRRQTRFTVTSRLAQPAKLYLRHRLESDWTLVEAPDKKMKVGDSDLFEIDLAPHETKYVTIAEATPVERSMQLGSTEALDMMKVFIDEPDASADLKSQVKALLDTNKSAADLTDKISTLRDQLAEYRQRSGELHAQLVTLKLVKTSGDLMAALRARLAETTDRMQKATIAIVDAQEQLMLTRVKFQNQLADLRLTDVTAKR